MMGHINLTEVHRDDWYREFINVRINTVTFFVVNSIYVDLFVDGNSCRKFKPKFFFFNPNDFFRIKTFTLVKAWYMFFWCSIVGKLRFGYASEKGDPVYCPRQMKKRFKYRIFRRMCRSPIHFTRKVKIKRINEFFNTLYWDDLDPKIKPIKWLRGANFIKRGKNVFFFKNFFKASKNIILLSTTNLIKLFFFIKKTSFTVFFIRKQKFFNKGRYSRNRQLYRTGVFWCVYVNIVAVLGLNYLFYKFSINFLQYWWFFFSIVFISIFPYFFKASFQFYKNALYNFIYYVPNNFTKLFLIFTDIFNFFLGNFDEISDNILEFVEDHFYAFFE